MDIKLRTLVDEAAGVYFIVTDNSGVTPIINTDKMRVIFINVPRNPVNVAVSFAKGDVAAFTKVFGTQNRRIEKGGNFSIQTCLDALKKGPITVINLRAFDDVKDKTQMNFISSKATDIANPVETIPYTKLFSTDRFWTPEADNIFEGKEKSGNLLGFGNVASHDLSYFVTKSVGSYTQYTNEGEKSIAGMSLQVDDYPALNHDSLLKDTFVDVHVFNTVFGPDSNTNKYYGHLFGVDGSFDMSRIEELKAIREAGFNRMITGTVIPDLKNEFGEIISISNQMNSQYTETGLITAINYDALEVEDTSVIDLDGDLTVISDILEFESAGPITDKVELTKNYQVLSVQFPKELTAIVVDTKTEVAQQINVVKNTNVVVLDGVVTAQDAFVGYCNFTNNSIGLGDRIINKASDELYLGTIKKITFGVWPEAAGLDGIVQDGPKPGCYKIEVDVPVFKEGETVLKYNGFKKIVKPTNLESYKIREEQFTDGSAKRQSEILDMMNNPGIAHGISGITGVRYLVDAFKSFIEPSYKYQFGNLKASLAKRNVFVNSILNDLFITDLKKSTNPLFRESPGAPFDIKYISTGGNRDYSTEVVTKPTGDSESLFFFGPGMKDNNLIRPIAGIVSGLFYEKALAYDVVANETGYIDLDYPLEELFDDNSDRKHLEKFGYNYIMMFGNLTTIYGNRTASPLETALQQIHNSEGLVYIKEQLLNIGRPDVLKKSIDATDYLRTETEIKEFFLQLSLSGAVEPDYTVICNETNNTRELRKRKIKLVHIKYTPIGVDEKVVFDLELQ